MKIIESSKVFREDIVDKVIKFAFQPAGQSTRTSDDIKAPIVLAAQFSLLLQIPNISDKIENKENKIILADPEKLANLKSKFTIAITEEILRRQENDDLAELI